MCSSDLSEWQGACCTVVRPFHAEDASDLGRIVAAKIQDSENPINPRYVGIDSVGVGASTVNELKRLGIRVRGISGSMRPIPMVDREGMWETNEEGEQVKKPVVVEAERYANQRSQVFWRLREDVRLGRIAFPNDPKLFEELTALEYEEPGGKITVAPKDALKVRLGRSPDRADAVAYGNFVRPRLPLQVSAGDNVDLVLSHGRMPNRDTSLERYLEEHEKRQRREERWLERKLRRTKGLR